MTIDIETILYGGTIIMLLMSVTVVLTVYILHNKLRKENKKYLF